MRDINPIVRALKEKKDEFSRYADKALEWYRQQSKVKKALIMVLAAVMIILNLTMIFMYKHLIHILVVLSDKWHDFKFGGVLLFTLVFMVGFPPLLGFSALSMLSGMVYGFPQGWPLLAAASISGSFCSFIVFRYVLRKQALRMIEAHEKFRAFTEILREDSSLVLLILVRLCPFPYSLSNGALAAVPELSPLTYFLASLLTSPKFLIHIFVGAKLKSLGDEQKTLSTKIIDVISLLLTICAASLTTYIIYNKMQEKLESYHQSRDIDGQRNNDLVFGNFGEDAESGENVELNTSDYDVDNFIIEDEGEDNNLIKP